MQQKSSGITPENLEPSEGGEAAYYRLRAAFSAAHLDEAACDRFISAIDTSRHSAPEREPPELE
ncbi:hypothetical protein [Rhizobium sp. C1]|uniref:hypothetical protein n=1 Tax=Rhizobium sp. C1 TaxID=1349799 RepID=UPI001E584482|nr:hypothetical protein [Rhizobium sp. C1]MCD2180269.1 hypothetical protein [Rhizobium sp. C1]